MPIDWRGIKKIIYPMTVQKDCFGRSSLAMTTNDSDFFMIFFQSLHIPSIPFQYKPSHIVLIHHPARRSID